MFRQQRTRNRNKFDPGQPPLRRVIALTSVEWAPGTDLLLNFAGEILIHELPPITCTGAGALVSATLVGTSSLLLSFTSQIASDAVCTIPPNLTQVRGKNGGFIDGQSFAVGIGTLGTLPPLVRVVSAVVNGEFDFDVTFSAAVPGLTLESVLFDGNAIAGASELSPTTYRITVDVEPFATMPCTFNAWGEGLLSSNGSWVAPVIILLTN